MKPLDFFADRNTEWLKMANTVCNGDPNVYKEVLQEAYLKLNNAFEDRIQDLKDMHPNQIGIYMWLTLKSCYIAYSKSLSQTVELPENLEIEDEEYIETPDPEPLVKEIEAILSELHWYDQKLFKLKYYEGIPMRKIARETNISLSSIFHTLKTCRETIKQKIDE